MKRKRLCRLTFRIFICSFTFYIFYLKSTKMILLLKPYTRQKKLYEEVRDLDTPRNVTKLVRNRLVLQHVPQFTVHDFQDISQLEIVSSRTVKQISNFALPKFNKNRPLVFLHIGKNGGSSFDVTISQIIYELNGTYIGFKHFDWSYIETIPKADVVVLLREPVSRAVSHYYYERKTSKNQLNQVPLSTYLNHPEEMLRTRKCWQDGQASVAWLTGTHTADWVGIEQEQVPSSERMSLNISEMCFLAAKRLESTFWFGIIEDLERSIDLLRYQLGWPEKIIFRKSNVNKHPKPTENITRILSSLMPQDIWLYEYAKLLFEARWTFYKTGIYKSPDMPPVPTLESVPCLSTRSIILCKNGPLSPLYYVRSDASVQDKRLPEEVWSKLKLGNRFVLDRKISMS